MKRRVLVVNPNRKIADTLGLIFLRSGYDCRVSYSAVEALERSEEFCPELLLCDIPAAAAEGLEVAADVTGKCPECRVLLLTRHYASVASIREWMRNHRRPSRMVIKPAAPTLLLKEAHALLGGREPANT